MELGSLKRDLNFWWFRSFLKRKWVHSVKICTCCRNEDDGGVAPAEEERSGAIDGQEAVADRSRGISASWLACVSPVVINFLASAYPSFLAIVFAHPESHRILFFFFF